MTTLRYRIMVTESFTGAREFALCDCDGSPEAIAEAAYQKLRPNTYGERMYWRVRIIDLDRKSSREWNKHDSDKYHREMRKAGRMRTTQPDIPGIVR